LTAALFEQLASGKTYLFRGFLPVDPNSSAGSRATLPDHPTVLAMSRGGLVRRWRRLG